MASIFFRTLLIYFLITVLLRAMGKRQVGEMELSELITTLFLSEIATMPIDDTDIPLFHAIVPILLIFSAEIIITFLKTKWNPLKKIFESKPVYLIEKGKLNQKELAKNRISINELIGELRMQGISALSDVHYAILEQEGKLSVVKKNCGQDSSVFYHVLIADGEIDNDAVNRLNMTQDDVKSLCNGRGLSTKEVFLLQKSDNGEVYALKKEV